MNLLFLRHGIAIDREDPKCPPNDFDRALTREGIRKMNEAARGMRALGIQFDAALSSPLVRARQTTEIVVKHCKPTLKVEIFEDLAPGMNAIVVARLLSKKYPKDATILLVGHEPDFGRAVATLAFGAPDADFSLKKGGLACVELGAAGATPRGTLLWLLTPALLRAAGMK